MDTYSKVGTNYVTQWTGQGFEHGPLAGQPHSWHPENSEKVVGNHTPNQKYFAKKTPSHEFPFVSAKRKTCTPHENQLLEPENGPLQEETPFGNHNFQVPAVSFRGVHLSLPTPPSLSLSWPLLWKASIHLQWRKVGRIWHIRTEYGKLLVGVALHLPSFPHTNAYKVRTFRSLAHLLSPNRDMCFDVKKLTNWFFSHVILHANPRGILHRIFSELFGFPLNNCQCRAWEQLFGWWFLLDFKRNTWGFTAEFDQTSVVECQHQFSFLVWMCVFFFAVFNPLIFCSTVNISKGLLFGESFGCLPQVSFDFLSFPKLVSETMIFKTCQLHSSALATPWRCLTTRRRLERWPGTDNRCPL